METIRVNDEEKQIGHITCTISDTEAAAYVSGKAIRQWMPIIHEVRGRGVFCEEIIHIKDSGSKVKFIFNPNTDDPNVMRVTVKQLIAQAAKLHHNRNMMRARASHPSNPDGLVVVNPDRYHRAPKSPFTNVPTRVRRK